MAKFDQALLDKFLNDQRRVTLVKTLSKYVKQGYPKDRDGEGRVKLKEMVPGTIYCDDDHSPTVRLVVEQVNKGSTLLGFVSYALYKVNKPNGAIDPASKCASEVGMSRWVSLGGAAWVVRDYMFDPIVTVTAKRSKHEFPPREDTRLDRIERRLELLERMVSSIESMVVHQMEVNANSSATLLKMDGLLEEFRKAFTAKTSGKLVQGGRLENGLITLLKHFEIDPRDGKALTRKKAPAKDARVGKEGRSFSKLQKLRAT